MGMGMSPLPAPRWAGSCNANTRSPYRHGLNVRFRLFLYGRRQSLQQQRMFVGSTQLGGTEGWRLQECMEFGHEGLSAPKHEKGEGGGRGRAAHK